MTAPSLPWEPEDGGNNVDSLGNITNGDHKDCIFRLLTSTLHPEEMDAQQEVVFEQQKHAAVT